MIFGQRRNQVAGSTKSTRHTTKEEALANETIACYTTCVSVPTLAPLRPYSFQ